MRANDEGFSFSATASRWTRASEGRIHFYPVYHFHGGVVAGLHLDARQRLNVTFVTGESFADLSELQGIELRADHPNQLGGFLKKWFATADLVRQSLPLISEPSDGVFRPLLADQSSP